MSREDPLKPEKDFSAILNEQLPIIKKSGNYKDIVDKYLVLEKQTRQSSDLASSKKVLLEIVETLAKEKDWDYLNELIPSLSKKHGQLKSSVQTFVNAVIENLNQLDEDDSKQLDTKVKLIETIRTVTDKKIFVEVERAIVSKMLSEIYMNKLDNLNKAAEILCDLPVETYSLMKFSTKIEYILEQVRLTLKKGDYAQGKILSRKIMLKSLKNFEEADQYKATYLQYLIEIGAHEDDYISIVQNFLLLIDIPLVKESKQFVSYLESIIYYIILSPYDNLQSDLIHKIKSNSVFSKKVEKPIYSLLEIFTTNELIHWSDIEGSYRKYFNASPIFKKEKNIKNLQIRIVEHNLRIINKYYNCINMDRLAYLLQLPEAEAELYVSDLVNKGVILAKIDRPRAIIKFTKLNNSSKTDHINGLLNDWCYDIDKLLEEVDSIGHLINKEEMMHGIKQRS